MLLVSWKQLDGKLDKINNDRNSRNSRGGVGGRQGGEAEAGRVVGPGSYRLLLPWYTKRDMYSLFQSDWQTDSDGGSTLSALSFPRSPRYDRLRQVASWSGRKRVLTLSLTHCFSLSLGGSTRPIPTADWPLVSLCSDQRSWSLPKDGRSSEGEEGPLVSLSSRWVRCAVGAGTGRASQLLQIVSGGEERPGAHMESTPTALGRPQFGRTHPPPSCHW